MHAPEVVSSSQWRHVAVRTNCTFIWITRCIPQPYQENMTTLSSDTCSESLKTHKHDKKEQELIIGTLVMKITCTTCIIRNKLQIYKAKDIYSLKYQQPNVRRFSFHVQSRWKRNVPGEWGYMYLLKGYVFFLALILVYMSLSYMLELLMLGKRKKNCCSLIEFLTFHW